ncbi:MAG TPA: YaeQ family protein, partial [Vicinamibacterales bacterium]|nr:YaeQ family protein [Vicinamibacterales bacterium]
MALSATIYNFDIELTDTDRQVYESLALRVARHPSESEEYLVTRLLAYLLEFTEGIAFSRGVSDPDQPTIVVRDLTGAISVWIDIGTPDAARLHKASKTARRVVVYTHKDPAQFLKQLDGERIHRADALELFAIDRTLVSALVA